MPVTRVSDEVAEEIRRLIMRENLAEGARLPSERDLAERFGASRPMVSQALRMLSLMGMVEVRRGSGAYVLRHPQAMVTASVTLMLDLDHGSVGDLAELRLWLRQHPTATVVFESGGNACADVLCNAHHFVIINSLSAQPLWCCHSLQSALPSFFPSLNRVTLFTTFQR